MAEEAGEGGEGPGVEKYPYGEYVGGRDENLDRHGYGSALLPNGDIYEGNYLHGKRHGKGMYCFRNGARYDGDWRKGLKHGFGQMLYPDGTRYMGQWRKDFKHGHGIYNYSNGDVYDGLWYKGWRHGLGTYTYTKEKVSHYGVWKNGRMDGAGIMTYPCGYRYHGKFTKNLPIGPGVFTFETKWMQFGFYINIRDPAFDYLGAENLFLPQPEAEPSNAELQPQVPNQEEDRSTPPGIVAIWRARYTVKYSQDLLPPEPMAIPIKDSEDSLIDIIDYLKQQYATGAHDAQTEDEEEEYPSRPPPSTSPVTLPIGLNLPPGVNTLEDPMI